MYDTFSHSRAKLWTALANRDLNSFKYSCFLIYYLK